MHGRLATCETNSKCAKLLEFCGPLFQNFQRHWLRNFVELIAVSATQVTLANHHQLREKWGIFDALNQVHNKKSALSKNMMLLGLLSSRPTRRGVEGWQ
jgi:hypothetical protein